MIKVPAKPSRRSSSHATVVPSKWLVGSSSARRSGSDSSARASPTRRRSPMDNWSTGRSRAGRKSDAARPRTSYARSSTSSPSAAARAARPSRSTSPTVVRVSLGSWGTYSRRRLRRYVISPLSGPSTGPAGVPSGATFTKSRMKVDLPQPLRPIRPMRSPSCTVSETSLSTTRAPKLFSRLRAVTIAGLGTDYQGCLVNVTSQVVTHCAAFANGTRSIPYITTPGTLARHPSRRRRASRSKHMPRLAKRRVSLVMGCSKPRVSACNKSRSDSISSRSMRR